MQTKSFSNDWRQLVQDNNTRIKGTDTIRFILKNTALHNQKLKYTLVVCDCKSLKDKKYGVRIAVGSNKLLYSNDASSLAVDLLETKLLLSSTISNTRKGAKFTHCGTKDRFLVTVIRGTKYVKVKLKFILVNIWIRCNTDKILAQYD